MVTTVVTFMGAAFTIKESAALLRLKSPSKASQAMNPCWAKVAVHFRADPIRCLRAILDAVDQLDPPHETELSIRQELMADMTTMQPQEINRRELMAVGRLPRSVLHPNGVSTASSH